MRQSTRFGLALSVLMGMVGCVGQSGGPPLCLEPRHCLCSTDFSTFLRGTVIDADVPRTASTPPLYDGPLIHVRVDEIPSPEEYPGLSVGMIIGAGIDNSSCATLPPFDVGTPVAVFNYILGRRECPELAECSDACPTSDPRMRRGFVPEREACLERECPPGALEACRARDAEAWANGFMRIALETDGGFDFGSEPTGSGRILVADIPSLGEGEMCDARLPPPPPRCGADLL